MRKITKRSAAVITAVVVAVGGAGAAWAVWLSTANGTVEGTAGAAGEVKVTSATVDGAVVPGNPADVKITVKNENSYPVRVTGMDFGDITSSDADCAAGSTFEYNGTFDLSGFGTIGQGASFTYTWTDGIKLSADPDNDCQGAPFAFAVDVTAASAAS
jgi:hypothetical protein